MRKCRYASPACAFRGWRPDHARDDSAITFSVLQGLLHVDREFLEREGRSLHIDRYFRAQLPFPHLLAILMLIRDNELALVVSVSQYGSSNAEEPFAVVLGIGSHSHALFSKQLQPTSYELNHNNRRERAAS